MKWLGILWTVFINLITVSVVIGIMISLEYETNLQTISALIIFAYINVVMTLTQIFRSQLQFTIFLTEQNAKIIKSIPSSDIDQAEELEDDSRVAQKELDATNTKYHINLVGNTLVWIITSLTILGNIM